MDKSFLHILISIIELIVFIKLINSWPDEASNWATLSKTTAKYRLDHVDIPEERRDKYLDYGTLRVRKFNRTNYVVDGHYDLLIPFTDDQQFKIDVEVWQGNEYRKQAERTVTKLCSIVQNDTTYKPTVLEQTNLDPYKFDCPYQPVHVIVKNLTLPNLPFTFVTSDRFRVNITIFDANKDVLAKYGAYFVKDV